MSYFTDILKRRILSAFSISLISLCRSEDSQTELTVSLSKVLFLYSTCTENLCTGVKINFAVEAFHYHSMVAYWDSHKHKPVCSSYLSV